MNLESQVCSLELGNRLKELGVKQDSIFYWHYSVYTKDRFKWEIVPLSNLHIPLVNTDNYISAFTIAELGEMLPDWTETIKRMKDDWVCVVRHKHNDVNDHSFAKKEVDARAKMLIYLIESKLIEVPK